MKRALLAAVRFYQRAVSPALPPRCRFYPTCSAYAAEAIEVHGTGRGLWLAVRRLATCAPWHPGGLDPVPPPRAPGGTLDHRPSSSTAVPETGPDGADRRPPTTPPAPGRAAHEESSRA